MPPSRHFPAVLAVEPLASPPDAVVTLPGSKSITNRALPCAVLARGGSQLRGVGFGDDTEAMIDSLARLGGRLTVSSESAEIRIEGTGGRFPVDRAEIDVRTSGTTARFLAAIAAASDTTVLLDGAEQMRARPMGDLVRALRGVGADVACGLHPDSLPLTITPATGRGRRVAEVPGSTSSQFLSGLLLSGPLHPNGFVVEVTTALVSRPYVELTRAVMEAFGVMVDEPEPNRFELAAGQRYLGRTYRIEPDASAASYFLAAAAVTGGRVRVEGLGRDSLQGDVAFVDVLERMGSRITWGNRSVEVRGPEQLGGVVADLTDISDTAMTLAAIAPFATGPTRLTGIGFIRRKESDRIGNLVRELRRCGIEAVEEADGLHVRPGRPQPARFETYADHRMAMALALIGLRVPGIEIDDPGCVAKTFPGYWQALEQLRR